VGTAFTEALEKLEAGVRFDHLEKRINEVRWKITVAFMKL
jgi:hypothetical protein